MCVGSTNRKTWLGKNAFVAVQYVVVDLKEVNLYYRFAQKSVLAKSDGNQSIHFLDRNVRFRRVYDFIRLARHGSYVQGLWLLRKSMVDVS